MRDSEFDARIAAKLTLARSSRLPIFRHLPNHRRRRLRHSAFSATQTASWQSLKSFTGINLRQSGMYFFLFGIHRA
jgi:hypothetical protein